MSVLGFIVILLLFIYVVLMLTLTYGWIRTKPFVYENVNKSYSFSIIISVRNEQQNIIKLLNSLSNLKYAGNCFEIILVDDHSDDKTFELIENHHIFKEITLIKNQGKGKKNAIEYGISKSKMEYIVTTDGDCIVPKYWLNEFNAYINKYHSKLISAPVIYSSKNIWQSILNVEFLGLIGIGASSIKLGTPTMANGANLCFDKNVFDKVNGYESKIKIASGDDEVILYKVFKTHPKHTHFIKSTNAIVSTSPPSSILELLNQRVRWASKWKNNKSWMKIFPSIFLFLFYLSIVIYMLLYGFDTNIIILLLIKIASEIIFMFQVLSFFNQLKMMLYFPLVQLYYPLYLLIIGFRVLFKKTYIWKNRQVV